MTVDEVMAELESLGDERTRRRYVDEGVGKHVFGVKMGSLRKVAKRIKRDHGLAMDLWKTKNLDARLLAILVLDVRRLAPKQLERMVKAAKPGQLADWMNSYVVKKRADKESLREAWMASDHPMLARSAWSMTAARVETDPDGLDLSGLLDRIEAEMGEAPEAAKWTMNICLVQIGIHHPKLRKRATKIGETIGAYRDYPTSKGCTSPFAPTAIASLQRWPT